jgi:hypothetical protein
VTVPVEMTPIEKVKIKIEHWGYIPLAKIVIIFYLIKANLMGIAKTKT